MIFKKIKEIKSKDGVVHFRRWRIISTPWFTINLHGIYKADEDLHLHNHPWNFISLVLKGWYVEELESCKLNLRSPFSIAMRKKERFHKIETLITKSVYTLNFMWGKENKWGYEVDGKFVGHEEYRELKRNGKLK